MRLRPPAQASASEQLPRFAPVGDTGSFLRLLALGNVAVVLLVAVLTFMAILHSRKEHIRQSELAAQNVARLLAKNVGIILEKADLALDVVALEVRQQMDRGGIEADSLGSLLVRLRSRIPGVAGLRVADRQGVVRLGTDTEAPGGISIVDRDYFVRARDDRNSGFIISDPVVSRITDKRSIILARRLEGPDGVFAGVVTAVVEIEYLQGLFADTHCGASGSVALFAKDLRPIAGHPSGGDPLTEGGDRFASQLRDAIRKDPEGGIYRAGENGNGRERTTSYARVEQYPLHMVASQSPEEHLAVWRREAMTFGGFAALIILVALASSRLLYRSWGRQRKAAAALQKESFRNKILLHTANDGIYIQDRRGRVLEVNPAFCEMLGYSRDELVGRNISDIDKAVLQHSRGPAVREVLVGKLVFESRFERKDGGLIDVEVSATGVEVQGKHLIFAFIRDISARKLADAEQRRLLRTLEILSDSNMALLLAEKEDLLLPHICRLIVEKGGYRMAWVGFAETDPERTVRPVAWSGYEDGYLENIRISWGDDEYGRGPTGTAIRTGKTCVNQNVLTNPRMAPWREAAIRQGYNSSIALPLISDGIVVGALAIYATEPQAFGTEEVKLLEKLANNLAFGIDSLRAKARLATVNQELQAFTYASSHDLKTPLRAINSFSQLLELRYRNRLEGDGLLFLDRIRQSAGRMAALIDDLLAYAWVEQGIRELEPVDLRKTMDSVLAERQEALLNVTVNVGLPPVKVRANPGGLTQVLRNLLANALLYSQASDPPVIDIGGDVKDGLCRIWVRDNGIGFDMAYHDRIFEIFRRLHTYEDYPGTGIGLALVRKAMERMGGRVWANGVPGEGATFFIELDLEAFPMIEAKPVAEAEAEALP